MDDRSERFWKDFERTGCIADYLRYAQVSPPEEKQRKGK